MTTKDLAKIERVDLREAWPNEAQNFTPWLAQNIDELGEALGMDLELQQVEAPVGGYSLDILATDLNSSRPVIIENQLEATDHTHLGQLLTYAAGFDAGAIVWVTREFRDEHRQALDWLNQRTGEDTQFFGVAVELWRIADSPPAPHFRLAATPNGWRKSQVRETGNARGLSVRQEQSRSFRKNLIAMVREQGFSPRVFSEDSPGTWLVFEYPVSNVRYAAIWHGRGGTPGFEIIIERGGPDGKAWNQQLFEELESHREEIEAAIRDPDSDEQFNWVPTGTKQGSRIAVYREGNVYDDVEAWDDIREWFLAKLQRFREVFKPYLEAATQ